MINPFIFGKSVTGDKFINRKKELQEISAHLVRGQNVILYSPRRYGKTSLIKTVLKKLKKQNLEVFYLDLYRISSLQEFYRTYANLIVSQVQSPVKKLFSLILSLLPSLKPKLVYEQPDMPTVEIDIQLPTLKQSATLKELFDAIEEYLYKRNKRGCVVFDEFQEILSVDNGEKLEREMRSAFQHHKSVSYAFLGSKYHLMHGLFKDKNRPFYNFGVHYPLFGILKEDWTPYILRQFRKGGYSVEKMVCEKIMEITKGHPYYTQLFCSELWELFLHNKNLKEDCIYKTLDVVLQKEDHAFSEIWDGLRGRERQVLDAIVQEEHASVFSKEFITRYQFGTPSAIQRAVAGLIEKNLIDKIEGVFYIVNDPLFEQWLKKN